MKQLLNYSINSMEQYIKLIITILTVSPTSYSNPFGLCSSPKGRNIRRTTQSIWWDSCISRVAPWLVSLCVCYVLTRKVSCLFHVMLFGTRWCFSCQSRFSLCANKQKQKQNGTNKDTSLSWKGELLTFFYFKHYVTPPC